MPRPRFIGLDPRVPFERRMLIFCDAPFGYAGRAPLTRRRRVYAARRERTGRDLPLHRGIRRGLLRQPHNPPAPCLRSAISCDVSPKSGTSGRDSG